ncbi:MAG: hypothetical protein AMS16_04495, partial [Planctomycetes bacterium DG_58]
MVLGTLAVLSLVMRSASADTFRWQTATPQSQAISSERLDELTKSLDEKGTDCFLVVHRDRIVWEWYGNGFSKDRKHYTASLSKSMVGGMSLLVALEDGKISPDDLASKY